MLKNINLQLLAEPVALEPNAQDLKAPASVTFTPDQLTEIDRIATERSTRAEQAALRSYFQQQGLTDEQALEAIKAYKESNKTKINPEAQAQIEAADKRAAEALTQANSVLIRADATIQAGTLQIRPDRIDTVLSMATFDKVKVTDGKVDSASVKTALEGVLAKFPEWKVSKDSQPGFRVGADGNQNEIGVDESKLRQAFGLKPTSK